MSVRSFLFTGPEDNLQKFHLAICLILNSIDRRWQTMRYTCLDEEDVDVALKIAQDADVTMQEIKLGSDEENYETYPVLHEGSYGMKWEARAKQ